MMQEEPPKYEMCTNNQYDAPLEGQVMPSAPVQQVTTPVVPTLTIVQPQYVPANDGPCGKVNWREVLFISVKEWAGMSMFTYVACIAHTNIFSLGFTYAVLQASAEISSSGGLHLNPVITLGAAISGRMKPILAFPMILAQFIGCFLGAGFCRGTQTEEQFIGDNKYSYNYQDWYRIFRVEDDVDLVRYCFGELLISTILVTVFLRLFPLRTRELPANEKERQETENRKYIHALFVGLTIVALSGVIFQTTYVGLMNPFRAFGPMAVWVTTVVDGDSPEDDDTYYSFGSRSTTPGIYQMKALDLWRGHWVYWVGPIIGGILAGVVDRLRGYCRGYSIE